MEDDEEVGVHVLDEHPPITAAELKEIEASE